MKRSSAQVSNQAKLVKFDHSVSEQQKSKQPNTEMFSPTFAGEISSNPVSGGASGSGHVRRVIEETELYEENEPEEVAPLESWDWNMTDHLLEGDFSQHELSDGEKQMRGFKPPEVSAEELAFFDKQAMYAEPDRLRKLDVIGDVQAGVDVTQTLHLDTKLVRDWHFRQGCWTRRARMVAREFRGRDASTEEAFSPTIF